MRKTILVIDDEEAVREVTKATLEVFAGWTVEAVGSGPEGIALAETNLPDAILLDVMMPGTDGPRTLALLLANPAIRDVPVLFLTAKVQATDIRRFRTLGVRGIISKPFDPARLATEIAAILGW
ncbi:MAG: response regulator [Terriglobia bacterium]